MKDKACPFCGSDDIHRSSLEFMQAVGCRSCGASVLGGDWNRRTAQGEGKLDNPARVGCVEFPRGTPVEAVVRAAQEFYATDVLADETSEADARVQLAHYKVMFKHVLDEMATEFNNRNVAMSDFHLESGALRALARIITTPGDGDTRIRQAQVVLHGLQRSLKR